MRVKGQESDCETGSTQNETGSAQNESGRTQEETTIPKTTTKNTANKEREIADAISPSQTQSVSEGAEENVNGSEGGSSSTKTDSHDAVVIEGEIVFDDDQPAPAGNGKSTLLPADFHVSASMQAWAAKNFPGVDVEVATMKFVSKRRAEERKSKNWEEDWRGFLISWANYERKNKQGANRAPSASERRVEIYSNRDYDRLADM